RLRPLAPEHRAPALYPYASLFRSATARYLDRGGVYGPRVKVPSLPTTGEQLTFDGVQWIWSQEASTGSAPGEPRAFRYTRESPSDRKSTRLNSSHVSISYAVSCQQ